MTACTSCFAGYILAENTCTGCAQGCLNCDQSTNEVSNSCTACPANMLLTNNGACDSISSQADCGELCSACNQMLNGTIYCSICAPGAVMNNGVCINCPANCALCSLSNIGLCTSCLPGYYFSASQNCVACPMSNCLACNSLACTTCAMGYMLSPSLTCMKKCILPCATCSATDPSICTSCISGYTYNEQATQNCQPDTTCNNNGSCSNCPFGFAMSVVNNEATCVQCSSGCSRCDPNNANKCLACFTGSYLNGTTCASCPSNCYMCSSPTMCYMCVSGFVAQQAATQQSSNAVGSSPMMGTYPVTCLACSGNCATCMNTPTTCLTCQSGFSLSGNRCLNDNQIDVEVTFNTDGGDNSIFTNNYNQIMSGLASSAGVAQSNIIVSSIVYSSVILNAVVTIDAAPGSSQATNIQNAINNYFTNLNIPGLTVAQSTVVNPGGNGNNGNDGGNNTTLIVAIVIPIISVRTYHVI